MSKIIITPESKDEQYWREVWSRRQIIFILIWRDLKVRYKQSIIGVFWTLLKPAITIVIFYLVGNILNIAHGDIPYIVVVASSVIPWQFISSCFSDVSNSLINNDRIITKIYFPLVIIPLSSSFVSFVDFLISMVIIIIVCISSGFIPSINIFLLPVFVFLGYILAFGAGIYFASASVKYRDFRVLIPFILQIALYVSPIIFTSQMVYQSEKFSNFLKTIYSLNPLVCVIDGFRWCLTGAEISTNYFIISLGVLLAINVLSIRYFRHSEKYFAEFI